MSLNEFFIDNSLESTAIFLSASIPSAEEIKSFDFYTNPLDITDCVIAVARSILSRKGKIVFGGHPTISPLILSVAEEYFINLKDSELPLVYIYQSKFFENEISDYTIELKNKGIGRIIKTEIKSSNRESSLTHMRERMIKETSTIAAIFIGGKEGIQKEFELYREINPRKPTYLISSAGGMTKLIFNNFFSNGLIDEYSEYDINKVLIQKLNTSKSFPFLAKLILRDITENHRIAVNLNQNNRIIDRSKISVFISYAMKDAELFKIKKFAKKLSLFKEISKVFLMDPGINDVSLDSINKSISESDALIFFSSENSSKSSGVEYEINKAIEENKRILSIFTESKYIPSKLKGRKRIKFDTSNFKKIINSIYNLLVLESS